MNKRINKFSCWYIEQENYMSSPLVYFHKQTDKTQIRQLLEELPDLGLICLQKY